MSEIKRYVAIGAATIAIAGAVTVMIVGGAAYLQDREYKAAQKLLNDSTHELNRTIEKTFEQITSPLKTTSKPQQKLKMWYVGTITTEAGTSEVWQDENGRNHYQKTGAKYESK